MTPFVRLFIGGLSMCVCVCVFLYLLVLLCVYDIDRKSRKSVSSLEQCHLATAQALLIPFKCFFIDSECRERERVSFVIIFSVFFLSLISQWLIMTLCFVIFLEVYRSPLFSYIYIPSEGVPISLYLPKAKSSRVCAYAEKMLVPLTPCVCVCV